MSDSLLNVDQTAFDQAENVVITLMRSAYPTMDLRKGTVLRELIVRPAAAFYALENERYDYMQAVRSLAAIAENPSVASVEDINHILSNFNLTAREGSTAYGTVKVAVAYDQLYYVPANFQLATQSGLLYGVQAAYTVSRTPDAGELQLYDGPTAGSYYFLLPVIAAEAGVAYSIPAGTVLNASSAFDGFVTAEAHTTFTGGVDPETVDELLERLPSAIAHRSLESRVSIEAILRSEEQGNFDQVLLDLSAQGYGDATQLRDKHNAQGVAMGGKVDIYVRTFQAPEIVTLVKTGTLVAPNTYQITIAAADAPGFYAVRSVTDADSTIVPTMAFTGLPALGSYAVLDTREATGIADTIHDIAANNSVIESAYSSYQKSTLTVSGVVATDASRQFKVELYVAPQLAAIQAYVDDEQVRNLKADYLVRCPLICLVGVRAHVVTRAGVTLDTATMRQGVAAYINSRSFVQRLTESEILSVLHQYDILRVDTSTSPQTGFLLQGMVRDAGGTLHTLEGHQLDVAGIEDPSVLLAPETCVFAADPADIIISTATESE